MKDKSVRNMKVTPDSGKDQRDTQITDGLAKKSSTWNETNSTEQYTTQGGGQKGSLGGKNTNS